MVSSGSSADLVQLANDIARLFNKEELVLFCDGLGMDYEDLAGDTKLSKIRELTRHYDRRGRLQELVDAINRERPDAKLQIPYKSSKPQAENKPLSPANILSGIIVTVVGGLIVLWVTQIITSNATPISTPTVAPAVISSASTLTPQPSPIKEPTATSEPSPIPATPTTAAPTDSPTETPQPSPIPPTPTVASVPTSTQLPSPTALPPTTVPTTIVPAGSCPAEINPKQGDKLGPGIVRKQPRGSETAILVNELEARNKVILVKMIVYSSEEVWFKMTDLDDHDIGWIEQTYVVIQPDCQVSE